MRHRLPYVLSFGLAVVAVVSQQFGVDQDWSLVGFVVLTGAVVAAGAFMWVRERMLEGPLKRLAVAHEWRYVGSVPGLATTWKGEPFDLGVRRTASSVIRGTHRDVPFVAFNYRYSTHTDVRHRVTAYYSVVALDLPVPFAPVEVRAMARGEQALGRGRIEFESDDFNRRYAVSSPNPKLASDVLNPRTLELLVRRAPITFRIGGPQVVAWAPGRLEPREVLEWADVLTAVLAGVPDFVWRDHAVDPATMRRSVAPPSPGGLTWPSGSTSLGPVPPPSQESS